MSDGRLRGYHQRARGVWPLLVALAATHAQAQTPAPHDAGSATAPAPTGAPPAAPAPAATAPANGAVPAAPIPATPPAAPAPAPAIAVPPAGIIVPSTVPANASKELRCTAGCDRQFEAGRYRILIDPTKSVAGAMTSVDIATAGAYRVTGVQRSRRAPGLALGAAGILLTAVGAGMAIGGGAFRSGLTTSEETWFWTGMLTLGAGLTLTPVGFKMYSRSPRLDALVTNGPLPPASSYGEFPKRYREPVVPDGHMPAAGTHVVEEPRWGLLTAGVITFAASYGIMAAIAAGYAADGNDAGRYTTLLIPFAGPTIVDRRESRDGGGWTIFGTIPQVAGGVMIVCGLAMSRRIGVANDTGLIVTPLAGPGLGGLSLSSAF